MKGGEERRASACVRGEGGKCMCEGRGGEEGKRMCEGRGGEGGKCMCEGRGGEGGKCMCEGRGRGESCGATCTWC